MVSSIERINKLAKEENFKDAYSISITIAEAIKFYGRYWHIDFSYLYTLLIAAQTAYPLMLSIVVRQLQNAGEFRAAAIVAQTVSAFNIKGDGFKLKHAAALREAGDIDRAKTIIDQILQENPANVDALSEQAECMVQQRFSHIDYYDVLHSIHKNLLPKTYLEIGVAMGRSLALAHKNSLSVGVDPDTGSKERISFHSPENEPTLFRLTSDDFFNTQNITELFGGKTIDVAFLDGLHHYDQTLRDFINTEKYSSRDTMVLIHDCLPINPTVASRNRQSGFWTGDVWKIIPILKTIRPDLDIVTLPVKPSGLAVVKNLDSKSTVLSRQLKQITEHFDDLPLPDTFEKICQLCQVTDKPFEEVLGLKLP